MKTKIAVLVSAVSFVFLTSSLLAETLDPEGNKKYHADVRAFIAMHPLNKNGLYKGPSKDAHGNSFQIGQFHLRSGKHGIMEIYQGNGLWQPVLTTRDESRGLVTLDLDARKAAIAAIVEKEYKGVPNIKPSNADR